jgi:arginine/lysine/ornithine decarboxylase
MSPVEAYEVLVKGQVETLTLDKIAGRSVATGIVPYPPGIPILMPGEDVGAADGPILGYLKSLEAIDRLFPGFGHDTHGVEIHDGTYRLQCLRKRGR